MGDEEEPSDSQTRKAGRRIIPCSCENRIEKQCRQYHFPAEQRSDTHIARISIGAQAVLGDIILRYAAQQEEQDNTCDDGADALADDIPRQL